MGKSKFGTIVRELDRLPTTLDPSYAYGKPAGTPTERALAILARQAPTIRLASRTEWYAIEGAADAVLDVLDEEHRLEQVEALLADPARLWPIGARIAARLARSKLLVAKRSRPLHLSVVIPIFRERARLQEPWQNPLGEAWLDRKIEQIQWLLEEAPGTTWDLLLVDDGCPERSGRAAREHLEAKHPSVDGRTIFLRDAIATRHPAVDGLKRVESSRKGGAVHLGLWEASERRVDDQVILYTDADLSSHMGQAGLLIDALDRPGTRIASGCRRDHSSIVAKESGRDLRGRLFIFLWKQLAPDLAHIHDTQCGFKALRPETVRGLVQSATEPGFAHDFELLARCEKESPKSVRPVPIAWIDSPAASTTTEDDPYLAMLRTIERLSENLREGSPQASAFARVIRSLTDSTWQTAVEMLAPRLSGVPPLLDVNRPALTPADFPRAA